MSEDRSEAETAATIGMTTQSSEDRSEAETAATIGMTTQSSEDRSEAETAATIGMTTQSCDVGPADFTRDLLRWGEALAGIARTGMGFTQSLYERERYEEVLHVAADIMAAAEDALETRRETDHFVQEWLDSVGSGVGGYVTPKCAIGAIVGNDVGEILLVQRSDSGIWLYPTGWADIGYSPAEVVVKEVKEETGIDCEPVRLIAVLDGLRMGFTRVPMYSMVFHCRATGGELNPHPLETADVGWFSESRLPMPLAGATQWREHAFAAIRGEPVDVLFDRPRAPVWRPPVNDDSHRRLRG